MLDQGAFPEPVAATTRGGESGFNIRGLGVQLADIGIGRTGVEISTPLILSSKVFLDRDLDLDRERGGVLQLLRRVSEGVCVFIFDTLLLVFMLL